MLQTTLSTGQTEFTSTTLNGFALLGLKGIFVMSAILYIIFAFLVIRQIQVMKKTLVTPFSPIFITLGFIHLAAAVIVGLLFWTIL